MAVTARKLFLSRAVLNVYEAVQVTLATRWPLHLEINKLPEVPHISPDDRVRQHLGVAPVGGEADPVEPRDARHQLLRQHRHLRISGEQILPRNLYI